MKKPLYIYIDVDETLVRNYGRSRIPIPAVIEHVKLLKEQGAILFCWSSGGAAYAEKSAQALGIADCFVGFLPKPDILIDDMAIESWGTYLQIHPNECKNHTVNSYKQGLAVLNRSSSKPDES